MLIAQACNVKSLKPLSQDWRSALTPDKAQDSHSSVKTRPSSDCCPSCSMHAVMCFPVNAAAPVGLACGLASWLGVAQAQSGNISIDSTGGWRQHRHLPMLLCFLVLQ